MTSLRLDLVICSLFMCARPHASQVSWGYLAFQICTGGSVPGTLTEVALDPSAQKLLKENT